MEHANQKQRYSNEIGGGDTTKWGSSCPGITTRDETTQASKESTDIRVFEKPSMRKISRQKLSRQRIVNLQDSIGTSATFMTEAPMPGA